MKKREMHVWTWPIATYLFLGGLGAGINITVAIADLFFGVGEMLSFSVLVAIVALGFGSFLLIFELGRPFQFWRVFSAQKAVLTFGAWMIILLVILDVVYASCFISWFPWQNMVLLRKVVAVLALLVGVGVLMYTGIELSSMKGRLLWNTPLLPVLFSLSGLLTGLAAVTLSAGLWPYGGEASAVVAVAGVFRMLIIGLAVLTLVTTLVYVAMVYTSTTKAARTAIQRWLTGAWAFAFWGGLIGAGHAVPLILLAFNMTSLDVVAYVLIIIGGGFLRFLVVYSDDRQLLPGESAYWKRLPKGDEAFIDRNWG